MDQMLATDVMELAQREWEASIVFAPRREETLKFGVDYSKLRVLAFQDFYSFVVMDECIESLGDDKILTTLDADGCCWQVERAYDDLKATASASFYGVISSFVCYG